MRDLNVQSLRQLRRRKYTVKRKIREFEYDFEENIYSLTHPFSGHRFAEMLENDLDGSYSNSGISKIIVNGRRLIEIAKLGVNIFKDFKRK